MLDSNRLKSRKRLQPLASINVTPFVDVMLVLLIVFMITAPLLTVGVPVDLPQTNAASINDSEEPLVITITEKGKIYIQETPVKKNQMIARLKAITNNTQPRIFIRGDKSLNYGSILQIMGQLSSAGFSKVALLAKIPDSKP